MRQDLLVASCMLLLAVHTQGGWLIYGMMSCLPTIEGKSYQCKTSHACAYPNTTIGQCEYGFCLGITTNTARSKFNLYSY